VNTNNPIFKSPELEDQYMKVYQAVLDLWPVPYEPMDVPTRFGSTHINACGEKGLLPLVLLPGFGANSTMWFPNVADLSRRFRIYALDTPGQPGKSLPTEPISVSNSHHWIEDVFNGLGLERATLAGVSLGGWLTLNFALHVPARVDRIILLDPAASFEGMKPAFFWHSLIPFMIHPTRQGLIRFFSWMMQGYQTDRTWGELMLLGILNLRPQPPLRATVFSDEDLLKLETPTLLFIGGRSVIYDPQRAYRRATRLMPHLQAQIIPDASHGLAAEKADLVNARILQFCQSQAEGEPQHI
jgi:pimeloyl-ACP methyl ester carboxylesterase